MTTGDDGSTVTTSVTVTITVDLTLVDVVGTGRDGVLKVVSLHK